jgi:hypothetical protein
MLPSYTTLITSFAHWKRPFLGILPVFDLLLVAGIAKVCLSPAEPNSDLTTELALELHVFRPVTGTLGHIGAVRTLEFGLLVWVLCDS